MKVIFAVVEGPHLGRVFSFDGHEMFVVGRSKRAHFRLPAKDEYFSRIHFMIEVNPPACRLVDMGSTNGTSVNGKRVDICSLANGDLIQAGQTVLRVSIDDDDEEGATRVFASSEAPQVSESESRDVKSVVGVANSNEALTIIASATCQVCAAVHGKQPPKAANEGPPWPMCEGCRGEMEERDQPIPGYGLIRELGRGGMGTVDLALRASDGDVIALKRVLPTADVSPQQLKRFLREASILQQLKHSHIVAFREMADFQGELYFALEFVPGRDAERLVRQEGPLSLRRAAKLTYQLLDGLTFAHGKGFVHRDIKPANVLIQTTSQGEVVKLADFGLARVYQESRLSGLTMEGEFGGTLRFMAPEQFLDFRATKPAADQYAAAATLYYLLTGQFIFDFPSDLPGRLRLLLEGAPVPLRQRRADLPGELEQVIDRALAKEASQRFPDVREFAAALGRFADVSR